MNRSSEESEEMATTAKGVAERLNKYQNKRFVKFMIPQKGFSSLNVEGGTLHDPTSDRAFLDELKKDLDPEIKIVEVKTHISTPEFARAIVEGLRECLKLKG